MHDFFSRLSFLNVRKNGGFSETRKGVEHRMRSHIWGFSKDDYDKKRYAEIKAIGLEMLANMATVSVATIIELMPPDKGYQTPKVDIRALVLNASNQLLMVQEKVDENRWSLPGGWADIGYTPFEVAEKEVFEETGSSISYAR